MLITTNGTTIDNLGHPCDQQFESTNFYQKSMYHLALNPKKVNIKGAKFLGFQEFKDDK